jgi:hypothetical protein
VQATATIYKESNAISLRNLGRRFFYGCRGNSLTTGRGEAGFHCSWTLGDIISYVNSSINKCPRLSNVQSRFITIIQFVITAISLTARPISPSSILFLRTDERAYDQHADSHGNPPPRHALPLSAFETGQVCNASPGSRFTITSGILRVQMFGFIVITRSIAEQGSQ